MFPSADVLATASRRAESRQHEAAHAIVASALGLEVHDIVVDAAGGRTVYRVPGDAGAAELEADLVATLAGIEAAEIAAGPGRYGEARARGGTDLDHAHASATRLGRLRDTSPNVELEEARRSAMRLVTAHWPAIVGLARTLELNDDKLVGGECAAAIEAAALGSTWRRPSSAASRPSRSPRDDATSTSPAWGWRGSRRTPAASWMLPRTSIPGGH